MSSDDGEEDDSPFNGDYREQDGWDIRQLATKDRGDTSEIIQHPVREELDSGEVVETMGLSVSEPTPVGVVTMQNTAHDTRLAERFVAFDVEQIDDIIETLEQVKEKYDPDVILDCPCCDSVYRSADELKQDENGFYCPCGYKL